MVSNALIYLSYDTHGNGHLVPLFLPFLKPAPGRGRIRLLVRALRARLPDTRREGVGCLERSEVAEAAQRFEGRPATSTCAAATTEARAASAASARSTSAASAPSTSAASAASAPTAFASAPAAPHVGGHLLVERLGGAPLPNRVQVSRLAAAQYVHLVG